MQLLYLVILLRHSIFPLGQSYLYTSLCEKYPGPFSKETKSNTEPMSPRNLTVILPRVENVSILFPGDDRAHMVHVANIYSVLLWSI